MSSKPRKKRPGTKLVFKTYWKYVKHYPFLLTTIVVGASLVQVANLMAPLYLRRLFNILVTNNRDSASVQALVAVLLVVVSMWSLDWIAKRLQGFSILYLQTKIMTLLQTEALTYTLGHSNNFFISNFAGSLTHKIKQFSRSFEIIADSIIFQFFPTVVFVVGAVTILFLHNHMLGVALGVWSICFLLFLLYVSRLRQPLRIELVQADAQVTATLADSISNQATIALFSAQKFEENLFRNVIEDWRTKMMRLWRADEYIWMGFGLLIVAIQSIMMFGAVYFWQKNQLTLGDFVLIQSYLLTTFGQLVGINRELRRFYSALAETGEMLDILELPHEVQDVPGAKELQVDKGEIEFKDVEFHFHEDRSILNNFSLKIIQNQKVALVGPSGAGKSTITKLLLRLFDVKNGAIAIDGQNIADVTQESLRHAISFVPQEPVLFHRTLMENIRYGRQGASDEEVFAAARKAHCHEFISDLPDTYYTFVGERGIKLSGGERQRVAIARAILKNAPILILDEATSSLDSESEALIQDALRVLMEGKTVVVIAHRLSTIMHMDRIVVIEKGHVVANGTHTQLLQNDGLYKKLWSIQAGGFLKDEPESD